MALSFRREGDPPARDGRRAETGTGQRWAPARDGHRPGDRTVGRPAHNPLRVIPYNGALIFRLHQHVAIRIICQGVNVRRVLVTGLQSQDNKQIIIIRTWVTRRRATLTAPWYSSISFSVKYGIDLNGLTDTSTGPMYVCVHTTHKRKKPKQKPNHQHYKRD